MQSGLFLILVFQTNSKSSTSVTNFLPKNNKVHIKLAMAYQGFFYTLFRGISGAPATSKMKLFVTLLNGFQPLERTKNSI